MQLDDPDFLVKVAEEVWRLGKRIDRAARVVGEEPLRGVRDSLERLQVTLARNQVRVEDHQGQPYHEGLRLDILSVEGDGDLDTLWVLETVRPTVFVDDQVLGTGEVILGSHPRGSFE